MKKQLLLLTALLSFAQCVVAQQHFSLQGKLEDETQKPLLGATVALLNASDSVLAAFAISKPDGSFIVQPIKTGAYILNISFVGYDTDSRKMVFGPASEKITDLGTIQLTPNDQLLEDVNVEAERIPILMDKDTITYDARAFKSRPDAVVEDLLKKLPGIEVERDGSIKAQGENVSKVLVDGKEFFGDDPQMATKNLPADAISKVKVYDKKSEFTEFSGVEDGREQKTINLELKEDKKNGVFGNVMAGYGTDQRYKGKANVNRFSGTTQFSLIGNHNNINEQGFSFDEYLNFMGGLSSMMAAGGGGFQINSTGVPINMGLADGLMTSTSAGLNLNHDFSSKLKLSSSYLFSRVDNTVQQMVERTNFLPNGEEFNTSDNNLQNTKSYAHVANVRLDYRISEKQKLRMKMKTTLNDGSFQSEGLNQTFSTEGALRNEASRTSVSEGFQLNTELNVNYQHKLNEKGRTVNVTANGTLGSDESEGTLNTITRLFGDGTSTIPLNQEQNSDDKLAEYGISLGFTEPLGKKDYLAFNASLKNTENEIEKNFFDVDENQERIFNEELSVAFNRDYIFGKTGVSYHFNSEKSSFSVGVDYQQSTLRGDVLDRAERITQQFNRFLPNFKVQHKFSTGKSINLRYRTALQEPSLAQLQPIVNNTNPLAIYQGNPNLAAAYQHNTSLNLTLFDQFSFTNFFLFFKAIYTQDKIINARTIDEQFRQVTQPVNIEDDWNFSGQWSFSRPLKWIGMKVRVSQNVNYNKSWLFLNGRQDEVNRFSQTARFQLENTKKDVVDIMGGVKLTYNQTRYAENNLLNQDFVNTTWFADFTLNLGERWVITQNLDYQQFSEESFGTQPDVALWRGSVSFFFLKNNRGQVKLTAFDLLNQNQGINRNATLNYIETEQINTLGRFFMLGFTYKLSNFKSNQGISIQMDNR